MDADAAILEAIQTMPDISSPEIAELLDIDSGTVSARLSALYRQGNLRRRKGPVSGPRKPPFLYRWEPGYSPPPVEGAVAERPKHQSSVRTESVHESAELRARIAELETWKSDAIARYPDLAVEQIVLDARRLVADEMRSRDDKRGAEEVIAGKRDDSILVRSVVIALERAAQ